MKFYEDKVFPFINDLLTSSFINHRKKILQHAYGDILEVGFGSGLSIPAYTDKVHQLVGLDPNTGMIAKASAKQIANIKIVKGYAENLPFEDNSFDGVACFLTLCTVSNSKKAIEEIKRVLRPNGYLYFIEHVAQPSESFTRKIQNILRPVWTKLACGCVLNRETLKDIENAGFAITESKRIGYSGFPNFLGPVIRGAAINSN